MKTILEYGPAPSQEARSGDSPTVGIPRTDEPARCSCGHTSRPWEAEFQAARDRSARLPEWARHTTTPITVVTRGA